VDPPPPYPELEAKVQQLMSLGMSDRSQIEVLLQRANGDVSEAANLFFSNSTFSGPSAPAPADASVAPPVVVEAQKQLPGSAAHMSANVTMLPPDPAPVGPPEHAQKVSRLMSLGMSDRSQIEALLKRANGDVSEAANLFFSGPQPLVGAQKGPAPDPAPVAEDASGTMVVGVPVPPNPRHPLESPNDLRW